MHNATYKCVDLSLTINWKCIHLYISKTVGSLTLQPIITIVNIHVYIDNKLSNTHVDFLIFYSEQQDGIFDKHCGVFNILINKSFCKVRNENYTNFICLAMSISSRLLHRHESNLKTTLFYRETLQLQNKVSGIID